MRVNFDLNVFGWAMIVAIFFVAFVLGRLTA